MPKLIIKITNQAGDHFVHRTVAGISGREYLFMFDQALQAYVYEPTEEFEINDIFDLVALPNFPFRFGPILVEGTASGQQAARLTCPPWVTPDKYRDHTLDELNALASDCGFTPVNRHSVEDVRAQLHAYFVGRAVGEKVASGAATVLVDPDETPAPAPQSPADPEPVTTEEV